LKLQVYIGLSHSFQGWPQTPAPFVRHRHAKDIKRLGPQILFIGPPEIFVKRVEGVGLQFPVDAPQFLLNPVHLVEEGTPIQLQLPAAEPPVRAEKEMKPEEFMFGCIEKSLTNQTEIRDIFFIPPAPDLPPVRPSDDREPRNADVFFFFDTMPESGIAGSEYAS
jgi:hypothetical protein